MAGLLIVHVVVFEKLKMSQPIRVHGRHLGFPIEMKSNDMSAGPLENNFVKCLDKNVTKNRLLSAYMIDANQLVIKLHSIVYSRNKSKRHTQQKNIN